MAEALSPGCGFLEKGEETSQHLKAPFLRGKVLHSLCQPGVAAEPTAHEHPDAPASLLEGAFGAGPYAEAASNAPSRVYFRIAPAYVYRPFGTGFNT